jgi:hypothetical protein
MSGFWLLERIGLHRLDIFLTKALNRQESWAEFRLETDREIESQHSSGVMLRPIDIRFYYTGDKLKTISLEGVFVERQRKYKETVTTMNYYDREEDVPEWILDMVAAQIEARGER